MIGLHRELAPLGERGWKRIEEEAAGVLRLHLAARRLMDFEGPHGWDHSAIDLRRVAPLEAPGPGVILRKRVVRPLVEVRVVFDLDRRELERLDRGANGVDLDPLRGGALVSRRGGDFEMVCGRDACIGYLDHDDRRLRLHLEESFGADLEGAEASVPLAPSQLEEQDAAHETPAQLL